MSMNKSEMKILNLLIIFKIGGYENTMIWKKMVVMKSFLYGIFWSRSRSRKLLIISAQAPAKKAGSGRLRLRNTVKNTTLPVKHVHVNTKVSKWTQFSKPISIISDLYQY